MYISGSQTDSSQTGISPTGALQNGWGDNITLYQQKGI